MKKFIFIIGGTRSGKSHYAKKTAKTCGKRIAFIATAEAKDNEMAQRISRHKINRPKSWKVFEESRKVFSVLPKVKGKYDAVIVDCLGLLVSNLLCDGLKDNRIKKELTSLINALTKIKSTIILVSNEVGASLVPDNSLGRRFCDLIGFANQKAASKADEVILMQSGIPLKIR